jgi:hypothetical protein
MTAILAMALLGAAADPAALDLPGRIDGWKLAGAPARYTPETLYEYIDGGAEAFLQFDFQGLTTATYVLETPEGFPNHPAKVRPRQSGGAPHAMNGKKLELRAEIYRHRDPTRAFGIYSQERRPGSTKMPGKLEGVASSDHLEFVAGSYYVKLALLDGGPAAILPKLAEKIAARLSGPCGLPAVLACFPDRGKEPRAEKLSARDFLGHGFLHDATAVPYVIDGAHFRLFVVEGKDAADVRKMIEAWRAVGKLPRTEVGPRGALTIKDPLNGEVSLMWRGRWLWGAVDDPAPLRQGLIEELGRKLPGR